MKRSPALFVALGSLGGFAVALCVAVVPWRVFRLPLSASFGWSILVTKTAILAWFLSSPYSKQTLLRNMMLSFAAGPACLGVGAILYDSHRGLALALLSFGFALHVGAIHVWRGKLRQVAAAAPQCRSL